MCKDVLVVLDDKTIPIALIDWVSELPHFCGDDECDADGLYEVYMRSGSLFVDFEEQKVAVQALARYHSDGEKLFSELLERELKPGLIQRFFNLFKRK